MKKSAPLLLGLLTVIFIIAGCSKPDVWEMDQWYTQMSRYRDSDNKAFSIYVKTLEEEKIQKICDRYLEKFGDDNHYLQIHFYDDRSFTPDYSNGIFFTEAQADHMVARYFYNPFRDEKRLELLK